MLFGNSNRHSIDKARTLVGYEPKMTLREGIRVAAEWYNANAQKFGSTSSTRLKSPVG
jgi:nucleoside-diphosphate-sugar epimerase